MSKSYRFLQDRNVLPPTVSANVAKNVSAHRRSEIETDIENGVLREGSGPYSIVKNSNGTTAASNVAYTSLNKTAQNASVVSSVANGYQGGHGDVSRMAPESYSPLWLNSNLNLPRDRATINAWNRSFFALDPIVHNAISLHSTYPLSKLSIRCPDKRVEQFFNDMIEETDLMNVCVQIAQEYWLLGEAFVYAELDERNAKWSRFRIQNPDYVVVKSSPVSSDPIIMLRADENLRRIVFSNKPSDLEQQRQLGSNVIEYVRRGQNIPLDNFYVSHIARKIAPYDIRGTGLPVCIFRNLMLFQRLRESKYSQADDMINPLTIFKVGNENYRPTPGDMEVWRNLVEQSYTDKNFKIITHEALTVERIGAGSGIYDTSGDITQLIKEIYVGLMVPSVVMDGGNDTTYANGGVALDVLRQRYMTFRNKIAAWLKTKIFAPISKLNDFCEFKGGQRRLIIPEIDWNHMSLFDAGDYISTLKEITADPKAKRASLQTFYRSLGLEYEEEIRKIRREDIQDAIRQKEQSSLQKMPLNELRALSDEAEIPEGTETPVPGENPNDDAGGAAASEPGALPGVPSMPDLGGGAALPPPEPAPAPPT